MDGERKSRHLHIGKVGEGFTPVIGFGGVIHDFGELDSGNTERDLGALTAMSCYCELWI